MKTFLFLLGLISLTPGAFALEILEYKEKLVAQDKTNESVYVLHFYAEWCSVCLGQKRTMQKLQADKTLNGVKVYLADFDFERKLKNEFGVERQSTLIVFRGQQEIARSLAVVDQEKLREFLLKGK